MTTPSSRRFSPLPCLIAVAVLLVANRSNAQESSPAVSRLFIASDFAQLAEGIKFPQGGEYTINVWSPAREKWSVAANGPTLSFSKTVDGNDASPRWQSLGTVRLKDGESIKFVIASTEPEKPATGKAAATKPAPPAVPAALAISTDPKFDPAPALDLIRGRVDTVNPSDDTRRLHIRTNQEGAGFHAPASAQEWHDRARAVREQLLVTMGLWPMPPKNPLKPRVYGKLERDGYTIEKVVLETLPGFTLSGNLYRPASAPGKRPAMLCPHGHWKDGRMNPDVQARCIRLAKLGFVVFMYDMVGYNDSRTFGHQFLNDRLRRWGLNLLTLQTWDSIRAIDWLTTLDDVDPVRIGCTGESGGGTQTFLLAAVDDRVRVAAPVVMVSDSFQGGCACENAAGLRIGSDNVEFAALAAPRPMKLVGASGDWTALTMSKAYPAIRDVYALVGSPDRVTAEVFNFPHNYNQTSRNAVYPFLARWLLGVEDSTGTQEGTQTTDKPEDLLAFDAVHPAPADLKKPEQLESDLIAGLTRQLEALAPREDAAAWEAARTFLRTSLRVRTGIVNPPPAELFEAEQRRVSREGLTIVHSLVGRKWGRDQIPVLRLIPAKASGCLTVVANPHGKARLIAANGKPSAFASALLAGGQTVVGFDPLLVGESCDPAAPAAQRPETTHFDTYNPALAGDQMQDLATVVAWARSQPGVRSVNLAGQGLAGVQVLLARPMLDGIARTVVDLHGFQPGDGSTEIPAQLDLPGILQFGGAKAAAALTAPHPLWIYNAGEKFEAAWPERAYALSDANGALRVEKGRPKADDIAQWISAGSWPAK